MGKRVVLEMVDAEELLPKRSGYYNVILSDERLSIAHFLYGDWTISNGPYSPIRVNVTHWAESITITDTEAGV